MLSSTVLTLEALSPGLLLPLPCFDTSLALLDDRSDVAFDNEKWELPIASPAVFKL